MDPKSPVSSLCLFKETRSDLEPLIPASIVQIQVPSTSTFSVRPRQQRRILKTLPTHQDEESFNNHCLASSGSMFFGKAKRHPRTFLWRVLQEEKILELRSADLSKGNGEAREASIIIQLYFPNALKHGGIALVDSEDQDTLGVFALTKSNELYTITLRKDFFCHVAASEEDVSRWCKVSKPATFSISTPHKLVSGTALRLIISLSDGRLLLLSRKHGEDGSRWYESTYGDGQWASSLRGLVRWQGSNAVKYDGNTLDQGTLTAMAVSPDKKHIFAVCLNHTLRIWNPDKATSVFSKDLLWQHHEPHEIPKLMLDPGNPNVLQLFQAEGAVEGDQYYAVTFSPHDFGQFKFWGIRDPDHGEKGVRDLYPECPLKPPDPDPSPESKAIWKVADFRVKSGQKGKDMEMWVMMRSNRRYKVYNLRFDILDLAVRWQDQWSIVASETVDQQSQPQMSDLDPEDAMDKWLGFIFYLGKYPESVLETALAMYCSERSLTLPDPKGSLKERMCSAVASIVASGTSIIDFSKYRKATDQEWTMLWQDIRDLDKSRWNVLSLDYDEHAEIPWITFAGGCSAVRTCDQVEVIAQNKPTALAESVTMLEAPSIEMDSRSEPKLPDELAVIIEAAADFRQNFSYSLLQSCSSILAEELWLDPSYSVPLRIQSFYDRCNFADEIGSTSFDDLTKSLEPVGGFNGLETGTFLAILEKLAHSLSSPGSNLLHTTFGRHVLINGAREMISLRKKLLFDLLTLIVFVDMEIDREEMPMENFDAPRIYIELLNLLKQYHIMQWLGQNERNENSGNLANPTSSGLPNSNTSIVTQSKTLTVLESLFALDLSAQPHDRQSQSEALTYSVKDLLQWVVGGNEQPSLDEIPPYVQTNLLASNNIDMASDFLQYQPSTAWSTYIKGRLYLARGEFTEAGIYFKKAAFKLSRPSHFDYYGASHTLLTPMESISFGNGLPTYYTHILNLFDSNSCPTQMAHFAHLALQLHSTISSAHSDQSTTLLTSLFQASLQTTDFSTAYSALTRHPSPETLLPSFIKALLATPNALPQLLSLPFPPNLHSQIDALLSSSRTSVKILAAWRVRHNDFRGAAAALLPPLQAAQAKVKRNADGLENEYLTVINLLACAGQHNGWVLSQDAGGKGAVGAKGKRKVVTIEDVRGLYQKELDRRSVIEAGRFGFLGGTDEEVDEMDVL